MGYELRCQWAMFQVLLRRQPAKAQSPWEPALQGILDDVQLCLRPDFGMTYVTGRLWLRRTSVLC